MVFSHLEVCKGYQLELKKNSRNVNVTIMKPCTTNIQSHRANAARNRVEQSSSNYYKVNVYYSFIDHVIVELETRFSDSHKGFIAAQYLVPVHLNKLTDSQVDAFSEAPNEPFCQNSPGNIMTMK